MIMILIAGPCSIEDYKTLKRVAKVLSKIVAKKDIDFFFKSSAVKDNRTKIENYSGVGMKDGISMLIDIKKEFGVKITTDFHNETDIMRYGNYVDLIQIPAYLAQQTSLIKAASKMHKPIHIKKPQFLGPIEASQPYQKLIDLNFDNRIIVTDRGTMFGYNQTIFDPRHVAVLKNTCPEVLADITHPNKNYPQNEEYGYFYSLILARSAIVSGADGIFLETHPRCENAKCDSKTMLSLDSMEEFIEDVYNLWEFINLEKENENDS